MTALGLPRRRGPRAAIAAISALILTFGGALAASPADADGPDVVATGLANPRLVSFGPDGTLYVAEAGSGGTGPCFAGPEGGDVCFGFSGAITQVRNGKQSRLVTGLPSIGDKGDGGSAIGPAAFVMGKHGKYVLSVGAGIDKLMRATLPRQGNRLGTLMNGTGNRPHRFADLVAFEWANNPDHSTDETGNPTRDSDPVGFVADDGRYVVADAGGNTILRVKPDGHVKVLAVFPTRAMSSPFGTIPMQAVPTGVAIGPDGAYYISELTGFPFPKGESRIYRLKPGHAPEVWATGLTNVTSLAWHHGKLYAVQISDAGLASGGPPIGSLVRVTPSQVTTVSGGLFAPYGVAMRHGAAYVSTCSVCATGGQVVKIPLP